MIPRLAVAVAAFLVAAPCVPQGLLPGREISKPRSEVFDTFLAYFTGVVDTDSLGYVDAGYLHALMPEFDAFLSLPFEEITRVERSRVRGQTMLTVVFRHPIELPIPFKVLWDTPGSIRAADVVVARETRIPRMDVGSRTPRVLEPVYIYDVVSGAVRIDFDPWIDTLLGKAVDDVNVQRALLFRMDGVWYAALMGSGYQGQLVIGYFDLADNRILVPVPARLRAVGARLGNGLAASVDSVDTE